MAAMAAMAVATAVVVALTTALEALVVVVQ
jgi:hypothetical protein